MKTEYDFSKGERGRFFREGAKFVLPASDAKADWAGPKGSLGKFIVEEAKRTLESYRAQPRLVTEHANHERDTAHGGYAHRQLFELAQNSADALLGAPGGKSILIRLTEHFLYCADDGNPIDEPGVGGLMFSHMSSKRNTGAIGRFGLGFKSVLGVTDAPEFYSRSGSFRFDKAHAVEHIAKVASAERYPVLRLPEPIEPDDAKRTDEDLRELMSWATNIVRLPLRIGTHERLARQIRDFPPEFLLFADHVRYLTLEDGERSRNLMLRDRDGELRLDTGEGVARWRVFEMTHCLSNEARSNWSLRNDSNDAPVRWAAPLDRLDRPGQFWAFLPTHTASLVAGILNAPWKTNEDRQNLLPGPYNEELIEAAAAMVAEALPELATDDDPARHLDALPRRHEWGDTEQANLLRKRLFTHLHEREIVPDQDGNLRARQDISYPPKKLTDAGQEAAAALERWAAYPGRPSNWLHHTALTRYRLAAIDRLFPPRWQGDNTPTAPKATIAEWLEALAKVEESNGPVRASMAAVQVAELIPDEIRRNADLGKIVLTAAGDLDKPDPERLFLPDESLNGGGAELVSCVHRDLASDPNTLSALKKLGLKPPSLESAFKLRAKHILKGGSSGETDDDPHSEFWASSRKLMSEAALAVIREPKDREQREVWPTKLRVRTRAGNWRPLHSVLLPGDIVPGDGSRDNDATVDTHFHEPDLELLRDLGVTDAPREDCDLSIEPSFESFLCDHRRDFLKQDLPSKPRDYLLKFASISGSGPLAVFTVLSEDGRVLHTKELLSLDATYEPWTMRHTSTNYRDMQCESLTIHMLRKHGRVRTSDGTAPLADALGSSPNPDALRALLLHPMADKIKAAFDLAEPMPEFFGEEDPVPLTDVWPGLKDHLPTHRRTCCLVRCERILVFDESKECAFHDSDIYLSETMEPPENDFEAWLEYHLGGGNGRRQLQLVADELGLKLDLQQIEEISQRKTPQEVEEHRAVIRQCETDAERLLVAVGEHELRAGLPGSLLGVLDSDGSALTGLNLAKAAIATWHTDALKQYSSALDRLGPPSRWAGSARAVEFVQALGFPPEWAGERGRKREPFLEVEGYSLPPLHDYQRTIADNVRKLLRGGFGNGAGRRGMISLPTGSGKTRVAVQALVEAMREDRFHGGVLWVADHDELCEQAVEAWRQVWSSIGIQAARLRISRMWARQPRPLPTNELHVVVATRQTLHARLSNQSGEYGFLADFRLVVFDEAHRSLTSTSTSVMEEIGLTRFQRADEPFMLGLTATPYRGHDERETRRLVHRYGRNRLDPGAFASDKPEAVIQELQGMGVLAQADHETIEGETFSLGPDERKSSSPWLPRSVENRIARSAERTKRIVEAYETHIQPDWPTLVFATSVEHAQTLAALLNRKGIPSRAVSSKTETATRRRMVEEFRRGAIKALVNYRVFREGFDAPRTRAIIVARPVYSPNLYFQMIGRGLRGPKNGGNERCLILNVKDNIKNFGRALAFSELNWLWATG